MSLSTTQDKISFLMSGAGNQQKEANGFTSNLFSTNSRCDDMVSLIDEEHRDRCFSLRNERTHQSRSLSVTKMKRNKKSYAKEQHFLKLLYMERLSERSSSMTYKKSKRIPTTNLMFMLRNSAEKRQTKQEAYKLPPSSKSRTSSSFISSLENLDNNRPRNLGHQQDLADLIKVKVEEGREMPKKRKKICRKIFEIFSKEKNLEKKFSQKLTLYIENKINRLHEYNTKEYLCIIKQLFNKIRVRLKFQLEG